jgi:hypothetical protein
MELCIKIHIREKLDVGLEAWILDTVSEIIKTGERQKALAKIYIPV